jgi:hypothetical protein
MRASSIIQLPQLPPMKLAISLSMIPQLDNDNNHDSLPTQTITTPKCFLTSKTTEKNQLLYGFPIQRSL